MNPVENAEVVVVVVVDCLGFGRRIVGIVASSSKLRL